MTPGAARWELVLDDLAAIDDAVYRAVAATPSPTLDRALARLSHAADHSVLWIGISAGLVAVGGASGRRAAVAGLGSVAAASAIANAGLKHLHRRPRPDAAGAGIGAGRAVRMPRSASFPSGHAASAFAFATAAGAELPVLAFPLRCLAAAVAYSRVHGGAHYPGDVIAGALLGGTIAATVGKGLGRLAPR